MDKFEKERTQHLIVWKGYNNCTNKMATPSDIFDIK